MDIVTLLDQIPQYSKIIHDLSRGNLKGADDLKHKKSKLCHSLNNLLDLIKDQKNNIDRIDDELSYFILFMEKYNLTNFLKILLDLKNFKNAFLIKKQEIKEACARCNSDKNNMRTIMKSFDNFDEDFELNDVVYNENEQCICMINYNKILAQDALALFKKYVCKDAPYSINASDELISNTISNICPEDGIFVDIFTCFESVKRFVYDFLNKNFFEKYLNSEYRCKYLLYILKNRAFELADLLYDDYAISYFLEYLEQEKVSDLLKFWIQAENFSQNVANIKKRLEEDVKKDEIINYENLFKQIQNDAIVVYDNYISLQAKNPIGFDKHVRLQIELNICQNIDNNNCDPNYLFNIYSDCFFLPLLIVFNILDKIYFNQFLTSKVYSKYVDELLINANSKSKENNENNKESATKEPLLVKYNKKSYNIEFSPRPKVSDTFRNNKSTIQNENHPENVQTTTAATNSANNSFSKIQIGHVDSLGRYIRQIEDEPIVVTDKKKPFNKLMNFLNKSSSNQQKNIKFKFSSSDVNDDEEEMALKAAEIMINDVVGGNRLNN